MAVTNLILDEKERKERRLIRRLLIKNAATDVPKNALIIAVEGDKATGKKELKDGLLRKFVENSKELKISNVHPFKESDWDPNKDRRRAISMSHSYLDPVAEDQILAQVHSGRMHMIHNSPLNGYIAERNGIVMFDRYILTTLVHQYVAGNSLSDAIGKMKRGYLIPDITFLLSCNDYKTACLRMIGRSEDKDRSPESGALDRGRFEKFNSAYAKLFDYMSPALSHPLLIETTDKPIEQVIEIAFKHYLDVTGKKL